MKLDQPTLLAAALKVFAKSGLEGASMRAIAREAGCDVSLLYYYFDNKEAVFSAILDQRVPPLIRELTGLAHPRDRRPTAEKLWTIIQIFHARAADGGFRSLVRQQINRGPDGLSELVAHRLLPANLAMRIIVRRGQRRGELRPELNPLLVVLFLVRMEAELLDLVAPYAQRMTGVPPEPALAIAERAWFEVFWRGIACDPLAPLPFLPPMTDPHSPRAGA
ncbi:MAG: helix-turn-helix domain containing protein [Holophaga sp.]|nr:helix-turn-helix domain containing protein [Holophaga sp.]